MPYNLQPRTVGEALLEPEREIEDFGGEASDDNDDFIEEMSCDDTGGSSSDEISETEDVDATQRLALPPRARGRPPSAASTMKDKTGYVWTNKEPERHSQSVKVADSSASGRLPGPANDALQCEDIVEFWELLFTTEMREMIVTYTNMKIDSTRHDITDRGGTIQTYHHLTDLIEINAFIGLLYYMGIWKVNRISVKELWANTEGLNLYRATMPGRRFIFLSECIRFDDKSKRPTNNKFACIEDLWKMFIEKCRRNYRPYDLCTVDEQLLSFRGRCGFRVYMKNKPDRFGLKIVSLNDAKTFYLINAIPYTGKITLAKGLSASEYVFLKVTEPIHGTDRSVTCGNRFTSIPLIEKALRDPYNMKITGTIRKKNKLDFPLEMKIAGETEKYGFHDNVALLSWMPKKNRTVFVASSFTASLEDDSESGKTDIISHYNNTKRSTDVFDKLCHSYTVARGTKRWPLRFFFGILDQAAVNGRILHTCCKMNDPEKVDQRLSGRASRKEVAFHLLKPLLRRRLEETPSLRIGIRKSIESILRIDPVITFEGRPTFGKRVRCGLCERSKDHKTKLKCPSCCRPMCDKHRAYLCTDCGATESLDVFYL